ncbi:MAG TPA: winged helix DNA-binding domain-containing protein [Nocardioidaceae bacterium]|nr:winged helix DNA-binding domain-containing protein [Nocardioidaceae bacterium]
MLTKRTLNRTLLKRQHLLERTTMPALGMVEHLVGLQAQDTLPPYVALWARLDGFEPEHLTRLLESRRASRILLMRGTIHLVSAEDCLGMRPLLQETLEKLMRSTSFVGHCADIPPSQLAAEARRVLGPEPMNVRMLGTALAERFPGHEPGHLANTVRLRLPLVQAPPRGLWKRGGGPSYVHAGDWHGRAPEPCDAEELVRRYLRAFGPATAADLTAWSGMVGTRAVLDRMRDELVEHTDENRRPLLDLPGLPVADPDEPAPVRLLGKYDNLWLSHADRTRMAEPEKRQRWMGRNGGTGNTVFVDGMLEGTWRQVGGHVEVDLWRRLTRTERVELDAEVARLEDFLAR